MSPSIACHTLVARSMSLNGEEVVISVKLHDNLSTNICTFCR